MTTTQQRKRPVKRAFHGLAGGFLNEPEPPAAEPVVSPKPVVPPAPKRRGRPPKNGKSMTAAERKARQRALAPLVEDQKRDEESGGIYGPGHAAAGGGIDDALTVAEKKHCIDENGEPYTEQGRKGKVNTSYSNDDGVIDGVEVPEDKSETKSTFQKRHPIKKNWTYDERDREELARESAREFITDVFIENFLVWDAEAREFREAEPFEEHRCDICGRGFWFWRSAVRHIIDSINKDEGDMTHRRRVLKGIGRPHYIPKVNAKVREFYDKIIEQTEAAAWAAGWVKRNGKWMRE